MGFKWIPNTQLDEIALNRLKKNFPKPDKPPTRSWFMGDIQYLDGFIDTPPEQIREYKIRKFLFEASCGLVIFPDVEFAVKLWDAWYWYLLPYLLGNPKQLNNYGMTVTMFMLLFPSTIDEKYKGFRQDIFHIMGHRLMFSDYWEDDDLSYEMRKNEYEANVFLVKGDFFNHLSPFMFFCIKYLSDDQIDEWVYSLLDIKGIHWRYQLMNWLYSWAYHLEWFTQEFDGRQRTIQDSGLEWWSIELESIYLPYENLNAFVQALKKNKIFYP